MAEYWPSSFFLLMTKTILLLPKFVPSKMSHEIEHSESEFYYPGELSRAKLRSSQLQQANRPSRKQLFRLNYPITGL